MVMIFGAPDHRIRSQVVERDLMDRLDVFRSTIREAVRELIDEGELAFAHQDPFDYLELAPAQPHRAARPMEVVFDDFGVPWICDEGVDRSSDLPGQGCWACGDLAFTASD
jgi:hypothetical protein